MYGVRKFSDFILIFMPEGTLTVSSIVAVTIYIPNISRVPLSAHLLQHLLFGSDHSDQCNVMPCCSLDLHFSNV